MTSLALALVLTSAKPDILAANIDHGTKPSVDFFQYANGGWFKRNPIPASEASWGIGNVVMEQLYASLRQINEKAAASPQAAHSDQQKIADFWSTAMDTAKAEQQGVHPLDKLIHFTKRGGRYTPITSIDHDGFELTVLAEGTTNAG